MEKEELMIGDWVYITEYPMKKEAKQVKPEHFLRSLVVFEPIPITPEILEKNGFKCVDNIYPYPVFRIDDTENYFAITIAFPKGNKTKRKHPFVEIDSRDVFVEHIIVNSIHELQHALKLCKIKKEITL